MEIITEMDYRTCARVLVTPSSTQFKCVKCSMYACRLTCNYKYINYKYINIVTINI